MSTHWQRQFMPHFVCLVNLRRVSTGVSTGGDHGGGWLSRHPMWEGSSLSPVALLDWDANGLRVCQRLSMPDVVLAGIPKHPVRKDDVYLAV